MSVPIKDTPLIIYWSFGPTFKDRIKANFKNFPAYKYFDVLVLTDDVDYFSDTNLPNVRYMDLEEYRKNYEISHKYEKLPKEKRDQKLYKQEIDSLCEKGYRFPCNIQRFALLYEDVKNYKYIIIADCDVIPHHSEEEYIAFKDYLENVMPENSISSNRSFFDWNSEEHLKLLEKYNQYFKKDIQIDYPIYGFDSLFKLFKFNDTSTISEFFNIWDYIFNDSVISNNILVTGTWNLIPEPILGLIYKLLGMRVNSEPMHYYGVSEMYCLTYPEDRHWQNVMNSDLIKLTDTREEFVEVNREILLKIYESQHIRGLKNEYFKYE